MDFDTSVASAFNINTIYKEFAVVYNNKEYFCSTYHFIMPTSDYLPGTTWNNYITSEYIPNTNIYELSIYNDPGRIFIDRFYDGKWLIDQKIEDDLLRSILDRANL